MEYWQTVLKEFLHRDDMDYQFVYTNLGEYQRDRIKSAKSVSGKSFKKMYKIDDRFPGIYFTAREAQTMYLLLDGSTMQAVGERLGLSARTVEFYVKNMRVKLGLRTKRDLVALVQQTSFQKYFLQEDD